MKSISWLLAFSIPAVILAIDHEGTCPVQLSKREVSTTANKDALCQATKSACEAACKASGSKPKDNTCNPSTLEWNCVCENDAKPSIPHDQFPIPFQRCQEDFNKCLSSCFNGDASKQFECTSECNKKFQCGQPKSTTSGETTSKAATATSSGGFKLSFSWTSTGLAALLMVTSSQFL